ncbi:FRG domain-containing protein [Prevotella sp. E13-17]|uniref:FRG domain-containing protein n=1 Tax=Prevotella sp. E13-17 TaxID=2913616 RepID=UPI001EDC0CFE|nr:FRG domain-containing protein [Prevotella sp. E13-17]UKK50331.1 FRG domain-containing protein [Prevotella sp. E13-17]
MMTKEEIAKLPTLLDLIDYYLAGEHNVELRTELSVFKGAFPTHLQKGFFEPLLMEDGTSILLPLSPIQHSYYRGESSYHEECYPSLYRKGMGEAEIFVERVKRCEMELLMRDYPITGIVERGIQAQDPVGNWHPLFFRIGYDGMAQHYGIKTEYMDLTLDVWTAAFFAATTYDYASDTYSPITDIDKHPYGAFYLYNEIPMLPSFDKKQRVDVVGMQPLARPGRQSAYVFKMEKGENFNDLTQKNLFRHDARVNELVFNYTNRSNRLFPKELLNERIRKRIVEGKEFSLWAFEEARKRYFANRSEEELKGYLEEKEIGVRTDNIQWFAEAEKAEIVDYWKAHEREFLNKIKPRWAYHGPLKEVGAKDLVK